VGGISLEGGWEKGRFKFSADRGKACSIAEGGE
jgi:hypothetical protein